MENGTISLDLAPAYAFDFECLFESPRKKWKRIIMKICELTFYSAFFTKDWYEVRVGAKNEIWNLAVNLGYNVYVMDVISKRKRRMIEELLDFNFFAGKIFCFKNKEELRREVDSRKEVQVFYTLNKNLRGFVGKKALEFTNWGEVE